MFSLKRRLALVFLALVMVFTVPGCITINVGGDGSAGSKPSVKAIVNACRDTYFGGGEYSDGAAEYKVQVKLRNTGKSDITYSGADVYFISTATYRLHVTSRKMTGESVIIAPGGEEDFDFRTDGYTTNLLVQAAGNKLSFQFRLMRDTETIAGPYTATLPRFADLPVRSKDAWGSDLDEWDPQCKVLDLTSP